MNNNSHSNTDDDDYGPSTNDENSIDSEEEHHYNEEFVVEKIVDHKDTGQGRKYQIKWKGYQSKDNTWEPIQHLTACYSLIREYEEKIKENDNDNDYDEKQDKEEQDDDDDDEEEEEEEEEYYMVEYVVKHRKSLKSKYPKHREDGERCLEYFVKCEGWPESTNTWEHENELTNCIEKIDPYWQKINKLKRENMKLMRELKTRKRKKMDNDNDERIKKKRKMNKNKLEWDLEECANWVGSLGNDYMQYILSFKTNGISGDFLDHLDDDSLQDIVKSKLHRKKIMFEWKKL